MELSPLYLEVAEPYILEEHEFEIACEHEIHTGNEPAKWLVTAACTTTLAVNECEHCRQYEVARLITRTIICRGCKQRAIDCWQFIPLDVTP